MPTAQLMQRIKVNTCQNNRTKTRINLIPSFLADGEEEGGYDINCYFEGKESSTRKTS
jgi:hypothetical protein